MTKKLYLEDTYQLYSKAESLSVGEDDKGIFIVLDQTVFYPQGGGQPSDQGVIKSDDLEINIIHVALVKDEIRHYISSSEKLITAGSAVECFVNRDRRLLNAHYHTAGHLIGNVVELLFPTLKTTKGHSFPNEAYIEFHGNEKISASEIQSAINEAIVQNNNIRIFEVDSITFEQQYYKMPYEISAGKGFRVVQIGDMLPVPCGGTHLSSTGEIENIAINKIKIKNNTLRISYEVV